MFRVLRLRRVEAAHEFVDAGIAVSTAVQRADFVLANLTARPGKEPVFFECRGGELFFVDLEKNGAEVGAFINRFRPLARRADFEELDRALKTTEFGDARYIVDATQLPTGPMLFRPRPGVHGQPVSALSDPRGDLLKMLDRFEPRTRYVRFMVRDDGADVLRRARDIVEKAGFEWRWQLLDGDEPMRFGL